MIKEIGNDLSKIGAETLDASGNYVIPGLVDIHTHGAKGADFCDGTAEAIQDIARFQLENGITSFLGTTVTIPEDQILNICKTARPFIGEAYPDQAVLRGIHLEGPFFSQEKRGAQNAAYIMDPDIDMFKRLCEACGDNVVLIAVAPELNGATDFITAASEVCAVSLAHSTADYPTACSAFSNGACHVTHLFNGMNPYSHREPGIIGAAFDSGAYVELISDGIHIHPSVVRGVFDLFGDDRVCLISDSMRACGLKDGKYELGGQTVTVVGRTATIGEDTLAGSVTNLADCMRRAVEFGIPLTSALKAATINPAKSVGLDADIGSLTAGKRADVLVIDNELMLRHVIFGGKKIK